MKKTLLFIFAGFLITGISNAQTVPNGDFENWTNAGTYDNPDNWLTYNDLSSFGVPITATKSTSASSGTYALMLESKTFFNSFSSSNDSIEGFAMLGTGSFLSTYTDGMPYSQRATALTGMYKYSHTQPDSGGVYVFFTKWNSGTSSQDFMGEATISFASAATYTPFSVNINYYLAGNPDSVHIYTYSSVDTAKSGSILLLDNLALTAPLGISAHVKSVRNNSAFPNPAKDFVNFSVSTNAESIVTIYNVLGKVISSEKIYNGKGSVSTSDLPAGAYLYRIIDNEGKMISSGNFNVVK